MSETQRVGYRFGGVERRGFIGGARAHQLVVVAAALGLAVGVLRATPPRLGAPLAVACVLGAVAFSFVPVAGETLLGWAPIGLGYLARVASGRRRDVASPSPHPRAPGPFASVAIVELDGGARAPAIGVLVDEREATWTAVLAVRPVALALAGTERRDRLVGAWGHVLAAVSTGTQLHRLQWIERTIPDRAEALRGAIERSFAFASDGDPIGSAQRAYARLVAAESFGSLRHECLLAVSVRGPRRVSGPGADAAQAALRNEAELLAARCREVGLVVEAVLSRDALSVLVRAATDELPGSRPRWPWPLACEERWGYLRTDGTLHAAYWVEEWPRREVPAGFLLPLVATGNERRTVVLTAAPVAPTRALHEAERARTSDRADLALRARHGFALSARGREDGDAVARRERELAQGHAAYRFSAYVLVTATTEEALQRACARVEQSAALAHLELRRLYGGQAEAFCAALPIGRGCA